MTTPIVVRTGGAGEALAQIGQAVGGILDPDKEKREAFENFLAGNPNAAVALGEQIRLNPEIRSTIFDFVPEETLDAIAATPRSAAQSFEAATAGVLEGADPGFIKSLGEFGAAALGGADPKEVQRLAAELQSQAAALKDPRVLETIGVQAATGLTPGQLSADAINAELNERAFELFQGFEGPAQDRIAMRTAMEAALVDQDLALQHLRRKELALIGIDVGSQNISDRAEEARQQQEAIRMVEKTNIGTSAGWQVYLFNLGFNRRGRTLLQQVRSAALNPADINSEPPRDPTTGEVTGPSDRELFDMANAQSNRLANDQIGDLLSQNSLIDALVTDIERERPGGDKLMSRSGRQFAVTRLNSLMLQLHNQYAETIPLFTAFIQRNGQLRFLDEDGVELETGNPFEGPNLFERTIQGIRNFFGGGQEVQRPPIPEEPPPPAPGSSVERQPGEQSPAEQARAATEQSQAAVAGAVTDELIGLPPIDTVNVDMAGLPSEESRNNLIAIQEGRGSLKQLIEISPREALFILENIRIQTPRVVALIDSLRARIPEEEDNQ